MDDGTVDSRVPEFVRRCGLTGCDVLIDDAPGRPSRRYCTAAHRHLARQARRASTQPDQDARLVETLPWLREPDEGPDRVAARSSGALAGRPVGMTGHRSEGPRPAAEPVIEPGRRRPAGIRRPARGSFRRRRALAVLGAAGILAGGYAVTSSDPGPHAVSVPAQAVPQAAETEWAARAQVTLTSLDRQLVTIAQTEAAWSSLPEERRAAPPTPVRRMMERKQLLMSRRTALQSQLETVKELSRTRTDLRLTEQHLQAMEKALSDAPAGPSHTAEQAIALGGLEEQRDLRLRQREAKQQELQNLQGTVSTAVGTPLPDDGQKTALISDDVMEAMRTGGQDKPDPAPTPLRPDLVGGREEQGQERQDAATSGPPDPRGPRDQSVDHGVPDPRADGPGQAAPAAGPGEPAAPTQTQPAAQAPTQAQPAAESPTQAQPAAETPTQAQPAADALARALPAPQGPPTERGGPPDGGEGSVVQRSGGQGRVDATAPDSMEGKAAGEEQKGSPGPAAETARDSAGRSDDLVGGPPDSAARVTPAEGLPSVGSDAAPEAAAEADRAAGGSDRSAGSRFGSAAPHGAEPSSSNDDGSGRNDGLGGDDGSGRDNAVSDGSQSARDGSRGTVTGTAEAVVVVVVVVDDDGRAAASAAVPAVPAGYVAGSAVRTATPPSAGVATRDRSGGDGAGSTRPGSDTTILGGDTKGPGGDTGRTAQSERSAGSGSMPGRAPQECSADASAGSARTGGGELATKPDRASDLGSTAVGRTSRGSEHSPADASASDRPVSDSTVPVGDYDYRVSDPNGSAVTNRPESNDSGGSPSGRSTSTGSHASHSAERTGSVSHASSSHASPSSESSSGADSVSQDSVSQDSVSQKHVSQKHVSERAASRHSGSDAAGSKDSGSNVESTESGSGHARNHAGSASTHSASKDSSSKDSSSTGSSSSSSQAGGSESGSGSTGSEDNSGSDAHLSGSS